MGSRRAGQGRSSSRLSRRPSALRSPPVFAQVSWSAALVKTSARVRMLAPRRVGRAPEDGAYSAGGAHDGLGTPDDAPAEHVHGFSGGAGGDVVRLVAQPAAQDGERR